EHDGRVDAPVRDELRIFENRWVLGSKDREDDREGLVDAIDVARAVLTEHPLLGSRGLRDEHRDSHGEKTQQPRKPPHEDSPTALKIPTRSFALARSTGATSAANDLLLVAFVDFKSSRSCVDQRFAPATTQRPRFYH